MKKVRIKRLSYSNFRGQTKEIKFAEQTTISGWNGSGKSTVLEAILWLITGADSANKTNFELFDNTVTYSAENAITATVEADMEIDGFITKLRKTAKQKWERARGSEEYTKAPSDDYGFYIDDLEVSATKYAASIKNLITDVNKLNMIINPSYWRLMDWKQLRQAFLNAIGEIHDDEFKGDYSEVIDEIKEKGAVDAERRYHTLVNSKDPNNLGYDEQKTRKEAEIAALELTLPDMAEIKEAENLITELNKQKQDIENTLLGFQEANKPLVEKRQKEEAYIMEKQSAYNEANAKYERVYMQGYTELAQKRTELIEQNNNIASMRKKYKNDIARIQESITTYSQIRLDKLEELEKIQQTRFDGYCPTCGAAFVGDQRTKRLQAFREEIKRREELCKSQGLEIRKTLDSNKVLLADTEQRLAELHEIDIEPIELEIKEFKANHVGFGATQQGRALLDEIEQLKANRTEITTNQDSVSMLAQKEAINAKLSELYIKASQRATYKKTTAKLKVLKSEIAMLVQAIADCERKEMLIEQYIIEQGQIIGNKANAYFPENIRVEVQKRKKSGEFEPTCKITIDGVNPFTANKERRVKADIAMSEAFMGFADVDAFMLIDEFNSFDSVHAPTINHQAIIVKIEDHDFRVE